MTATMAGDERHVATDTLYQPLSSSPPPPSSSSSMAWNMQSPHVYPHSHHGTPAQEYSGFAFTTPPMSSEQGHFGGHNMLPRQYQGAPQPMVMPQWPSMLNQPSQMPPATWYPVTAPTPAHHFQQHPVQPVQTIPTTPNQPIMSSAPPRPGPTPRRTLTDKDRKEMCLYAEEHPHSKQTEIGALFNVERSTVSKVLRQKEKYLVQDDGSRSPVKRAKGRSPDIERALAVWVKNQEKKGLIASDDLIRGKARAFLATTASPDSHQNLSANWLEKFRQRHNLMGARSRKSSLAPDDTDSLSIIAASSTHDHTEISPTSSGDNAAPSSPADLSSLRGDDGIRLGSPIANFDDFNGPPGPYHAQRTDSIQTAFTDITASSSFSPGPLSPTTPLFTPDSGTAPSPFVPHTTAHRSILPATPHLMNPRPRSQTFPLLDLYTISPADATTPKYNPAILDSPMEEPLDPMSSLDSAVHASHQLRTLAPADTMRPPPLPSHLLASDLRRDFAPPLDASTIRHDPMTTTSSHAPTLNARATTITTLLTHPLHPQSLMVDDSGEYKAPIFMDPSDKTTSAEDAHRALGTVMQFLQQQSPGFLNSQESLMLDKLMARVQLQSRPSG